MYVAGILNEVETVKAGYVGQRIVYEEEQQFAGYNSQRDSYGDTRHHGDNRQRYDHRQKVTVSSNVLRVIFY